MKPEEISEADNWLRGEFLELKPLINLARGAHPTRDWPPPNEWRAPFRNLKAAIDAGELLATLRASRADKSAVVKLTDLWAFLTKPERRNDTSWDWARAFCHRWADTRGESLPDPEKSRATTRAAENRCRKWLQGEIVAWRKSSQDTSSPRKEDLLERATANFKGLSKRGFQRLWDDEAPPEWKRPGPKSSQ